MTGRRAVVRALLAAAAWPRGATARAIDTGPDAPSRQVILDAAETALAEGRTAAAVAGFERAAALRHAADAEMGLVRAWLQQGEYRRALGFAAHTAGAHRDAPSATVLHAWLLAVGGQGAYARRCLDEARSRGIDDGDAVLAEARRRLHGTGSATTTVLLREPPHRMAPYAVASPAMSPLLPDARVVASGVLLGGGRYALLPPALAAAAQAPPQCWVRDGLGRTAAVRVEQRDDALGVALAVLATPLDTPGVPAAVAEPFAGSAAHVAAYAPSGDAEPAWPWLQPGFLLARGGQLGVDAPDGSLGAPVFDAAGRWCGIAGAAADGRHRLLTVRRLMDALPGLAGTLEVAAAGNADRVGPTSAAMGADALYERALRVAVQVIAVRPER